MTDRTEHAQVGDLDIAYESFGDPADPPLLLVMGLATQMLGWDERFCRPARGPRLPRHPLRQPRHRAVDPPDRRPGSPTWRRCSAATRPRRPRRTRSLDMAGDTDGLLDALGLESAHVVGASMGGMIAQQLAIGHPHRVRSLTSIMSTPVPRGRSARGPRRWPRCSFRRRPTRTRPSSGP